MQKANWQVGRGRCLGLKVEGLGNIGAKELGEKRHLQEFNVLVYPMAAMFLGGFGMVFRPGFIV